MKKVAYPVIFTDAPTETASVQSPGGIVWLASRLKNTTNDAALYTIISPYKQANLVTYTINISARGRWK